MAVIHLQVQDFHGGNTLWTMLDVTRKATLVHDAYEVWHYRYHCATHTWERWWPPRRIEGLSGTRWSWRRDPNAIL